VIGTRHGNRDHQVGCLEDRGAENSGLGPHCRERFYIPEGQDRT
jgi:hypothetical protein